MKKIRVLFLWAVLLIFSLNVAADNLNPLIYQYTNPDITVVFSEALNVTLERQQDIADEIAGIESGTTLNSNTASPDNIICTIFGHDLSTTTVTVTHHKVEQHHPRCLMELYHVTACSRCNYTDAELQSSFHILCCPED